MMAPLPPQMGGFPPQIQMGQPPAPTQVPGQSEPEETPPAQEEVENVNRVSQLTPENTNQANPTNTLSLEPPRERWKRKDDKEMFAFLRDYCLKSGDSIENITKRLQTSKDKDNGFWVYVSNQIKWKGPLFMLQKRFQKLWNTKGLSIREKILLRKLYDKKKKAKEEISIESILYHFPGRNLEDLQIENLDDEINGYFAMFKNPNHYHLSKYKDNILFKISKVPKGSKETKEEGEGKPKNSSTQDQNLKIKIDLTKVDQDVQDKGEAEEDDEDEVIID